MVTTVTDHCVGFLVEGIAARNPHHPAHASMVLHVGGKWNFPGVKKILARGVPV